LVDRNSTRASDPPRPGGVGRVEAWFLPLLLATTVLFVGAGRAPEAGSPAGEAAPPRSVILLIADGMGPQQLGLHLDVADALGRETAVERAYRVGRTSTVRTGSANSPVTDSAASATAMATGRDTDNGRVAVDPTGAPLTTCLEDAVRTGRRAGIVTTTRLTHATPASFCAHVPDRDLENEIAGQMLEQGIDILLGGGAVHFLGGLGGQDLGGRIRAAGYTLVRSRAELDAAPRKGPLLGLFHGDNLPYLVDRDGGEGEPLHVPGLPEMTRAALERLEGADGSLLIIEAGRIDHAGHANDAGALLGEMREFDATLDLLLDHIELHPEVALIVTADHETGGLCLTYRPGRLPTAEDLRALDGVMRSVPARPTGAVDLAEATAIYGQARLPFVAESAWGWNAPGLLRSSERFVSFGSQGHSATPITLFHIGAGAPLPSLMTHADLGARLREWMSIPLPSGGAR